jgi:hypothetical protein
MTSSIINTAAALYNHSFASTAFHYGSAPSRVGIFIRTLLEGGLTHPEVITPSIDTEKTSLSLKERIVKQLTYSSIKKCILNMHTIGFLASHIFKNSSYVAIPRTLHLAINIFDHSKEALNSPSVLKKACAITAIGINVALIGTSQKVSNLSLFALGLTYAIMSHCTSSSLSPRRPTRTAATTPVPPAVVTGVVVDEAQPESSL